MQLAQPTPQRVPHTPPDGRLLGTRAVKATRVRSNTATERHRLYLLARLMIERHYRRPLTLRVVAKALGSSPTQLERAYAEFGSFREDLTGRRMAAAADLLSYSTIPLRDVAGLVGYPQRRQFAKAFRLRYGASPTRFREQLGNATDRRPAGATRRRRHSKDATTGACAASQSPRPAARARGDHAPSPAAHTRVPARRS